MQQDELKDASFLIFANKQDMPGAMKVQELQVKLGLHEVRGKTWFIQPSVATTGDGIYEGLDWLSNQVVKGKI